jgi:Domain of unknown function (DUF4157)
MEAQLAERRRDVAMQRRRVQRKANGEAGQGRIPQGSGSPLADPVKRSMERHLGADLSGARVHTGSDSAKAAEGFGARAFTVGGDVHFNAGEFNPGTVEGDRLLAHELTHVVQGQRSGIQRKEKGDAKDGGDAGGKEGGKEGGGEGGHEVSKPGDAAEKEADAAGDQVADKEHGGGGGKDEKKDKGKEKDKGKDKDKKDAKGEKGEKEEKEGEGKEGEEGHEAKDAGGGGGGEKDKGGGKEAKGEKGGGKDAGAKEGGGKEGGGGKDAGEGGKGGGDKGGGAEAKEAAPAVGAKLQPGVAGKVFLAPKPNAAPAAPGKPAPAGKSADETAAEKLCTDAKKAMDAGDVKDPGYESLLKYWKDKVKPAADKCPENAMVKDTMTAFDKKATDHEAVCSQVMNDAAGQITALPKAPESFAALQAILKAPGNLAWPSHYKDNAAVKAYRAAQDKKDKELREEHDRICKDALGAIKATPDQPDPKNPDGPRKTMDKAFEDAKKWFGKNIGDTSSESATQEAYANKLVSMAAAKEKEQKDKEEKEKADKEKGAKGGAAGGGAEGKKGEKADAKGGGEKPAPAAEGGGKEAPKPAAAPAPAPAPAPQAGGEHAAHGGGEQKHEEGAKPPAAGGGEHAAPGAEGKGGEHEKKPEGGGAGGGKDEEKELEEKREEVKTLIEGLKAQLEAKALKGERKLSRIAGLIGIGAGLANPVLGLIVGGSSALLMHWLKGEAKDEIAGVESTLEMVDMIKDPKQLDEILEKYMKWSADLATMQKLVEDALAKEPPETKRTPVPQGTAAATPGAKPQQNPTGPAAPAANPKLGKFAKWTEVVGEVLHMGGEAASVAVEAVHHVLHEAIPVVGVGVMVAKEVAAGSELKQLQPAIDAKEKLDKKLAEKGGAGGGGGHH